MFSLNVTLDFRNLFAGVNVTLMILLLFFVTFTEKENGENNIMKWKNELKQNCQWILIGIEYVTIFILYDIYFYIFFILSFLFINKYEKSQQNFWTIK